MIEMSRRYSRSERGNVMPAMQDLRAGRLSEDGIRYMMIRPVVLMGVIHELSAANAALFFKTMENSAFRHAQASLAQYLSRGQFTPDVFFIQIVLDWPWQGSKATESKT
jgi:hypothetical protein